MRVHYRKKFHLEKYGLSRFEMEDIELVSDEIDANDIDKTFHGLKLKVHSLFAESLQMDKIALESVHLMQKRIEKEDNLKLLEEQRGESI